MLIALSLLGGVGLFLLGMALMTGGLKVAAGEALKNILRAWTQTPLRGLAAGALITGIVQSSSAVTMATIGFVNAGLLGLGRAVWVVFGANVGTTMTGWLVAVIGLRLDVAAFALPMIGLGMLLRLFAREAARQAGIGDALAGFGVFFLGIDVLRAAFADVVPLVSAQDFAGAGGFSILIFVALGALLTTITQSSSAAIALALTANAGGAVPLELAAAAVVGTNIGTTSTALLAALGANAPAKRVALAHIVFNLSAGAVALVLLPALLWASGAIVQAFGAAAGDSVTLAVFHTLFNCLGVALIAPFTPRLTRWLRGLFATPDEALGRPKHLDPTLAEVPALAVNGLVLELLRMKETAVSFAAAQIENRPPPPGVHAGVLRLGAAIRGFIESLNRQPLPSNVVQALPDVIRCAQHLEDLAATASEISARRQRGDVDWTALLEAVRASFDGVRDPSDFQAAFDTHRQAVETAYQDVKGALLKVAADGRIPVAAMEEALLHARLLRRMADAGLKARRRLSPWLAYAAAEGREDEPRAA